MLQLILMVVVLVLALFTGVALAIYHFFGAKGLIALPFLLLIFVWVGKTIAGFAFKKFALGLMRMKAAALKGATANVRAIMPVAKPVEVQAEDPEDNESAESDEDEADETDAAPEAAVELADVDEPRHYYEVDVTITPAAGASDRFWEPSEFILTTKKISSLDDIETTKPGSCMTRRFGMGIHSVPMTRANIRESSVC